MNTQTKTDPWLTVFEAKPDAALRLFCFCYAGGSTLAFRQWSKDLPRTVETCPIQLPGRGSRMREPLFTEFRPTVEAIADGIRPYLDRPFAFFGHSLGAVLAFEVARYLRREWELQPQHLFVSGHRAPSTPRREPPFSKLEDAALIDVLTRFEGSPREVLENAELMSLMLPIIRADFAVLEDYRYTSEPPLDCGISAFGGVLDQEAAREELAGWKTETTGEFSLQMFPGGHFYLHAAQPRLLQLISAQLLRCA